MSTPRDFILLYINGRRHEVRGSDAFLSLSDFLRHHQQLTGTKIVCSEGDCGACSVLHYTPSVHDSPSNRSFHTINSCITFITLLDCAHIVTVEGLSDGEALHPAQQALINEFGTQCGFCTPGISITLAGLYENNAAIDEKTVKNALTGNLCRCTGYSPIVKAGQTMATTVRQNQTLANRYLTPTCLADLHTHKKIPVVIDSAQNQFRAPVTIKEATTIKSKQPSIRLIASATDIGVQINKNTLHIPSSMSLHLIPELHQLGITHSDIHVGAMVTIDRLRREIKEIIPEFSQFLNIFASPQIKHTATLIGNIANGSPVGDTLPILSVVDASIHIQSRKTKRVVPITTFYKGYKQLDLHPEEIITKVSIPIPPHNSFLKLYKVSRRKDLDISIVNAAFMLTTHQDGTIQSLHISYGGVAPSVVRLFDIENHIVNKPFDDTTVSEVISMLQKSITPVSDVRGSATYRMRLVENFFIKFYHDWQKDRNNQ